MVQVADRVRAARQRVLSTGHSTAVGLPDGHIATYLVDEFNSFGNLSVIIFAEDVCANSAAGALGRHALLVILVLIDLGRYICIASRIQRRRLLTRGQKAWVNVFRIHKGGQIA